MNGSYNARPAGYVFSDDAMYSGRMEPVGDTEQWVEPAPPHEKVWKMWAQSQKVDTEPVQIFAGPEDNQYLVGTEDNPEYAAFKKRMQDAGYSIGMSDIPGYKYDKNFTIFDPSGKAVGEPTRLQTGQGFFSSLSGLAKETAPVWMTALTMGGGASALGQALGFSGTAAQTVGNALISGGTTALGGGDLQDVLKNTALAGGLAYAGQTLAPGISEALGGGSAGGAGSAAAQAGIRQLLSGQGLDPEKLALSAAMGGAKGYAPDMPGVGDVGQEGFFDIGGEGYVPDMPGEGAFLGENVPSGIPDWDFAAVEAGLPIGNLEQDFVVDQNGNIIDTAGNRGEFIDGEWAVRTDPRDFSNYTAPSKPPAPAAAPTAAPKTAAGPGLNLNALIAALAAAGYREEEPDPYQVAQINAQSPFGTSPYASTGQYT